MGAVLLVVTIVLYKSQDVGAINVSSIKFLWDFYPLLILIMGLLEVFLVFRLRWRVRYENWVIRREADDT